MPAVQYRYGWKPSPPDFRDHVYSPTPLMVAALPPVFNRDVPEIPNPFNPAWNQSNLGCHDDKTEVLTEKGWQLWPEYDGTSLLGTMSPQTNELEFQAPQALHTYEYNGPLIQTSHDRLDFALTPNHRMYVRRWSERNRTLSDHYDFVEAGKLGWYTGLPHATSGFRGIELGRVAIPNGPKFSGDDFLAMVAMVISCGWVGGVSSTWDRVSFCCFRPDKIETIRALAARIGFFEYPYRPGVFERGYLALADWFRANCFAGTDFQAGSKRVPDIVKTVCSRQVEHFLTNFGDQHYNEEKESRQFYSTSQRMIDDIQELLLRVGRRSSIYTRPMRRAVMKDGRVIEPSPGSQDITLTEWKKTTLSLGRKKDLFTEKYRGMVYCATVPNSLLVTRRNKSVLISGNSCGPNTAGLLLVSVQHLEGRPQLLMPSRLQIYYATRKIMGTIASDSGVYNRDMLKALNKEGWTTEDLWDYDIAKFKTKPSQAAITDAETRKITSYQSVPQNLNAIKTAIIEGGVVFGFTVYSSMMTAEVNRTGVIPMPSTQDRVEGGHDVLLIGFDDEKQLFSFQNSWGNWGQNGQGWVPYAYALNPKLSGDFWTIKGSGMSPITPPTPPSDMILTITKDLKAGSYRVTPTGQLVPSEME